MMFIVFNTISIIVITHYMGINKEDRTMLGTKKLF